MTLLDRIFVDSGIWIALLNKKDPDHKKVSQALKRIKSAPFRLYTSYFVISESTTYLRYNSNVENVAKFKRYLKDLSNTQVLTIYPISYDNLFEGFDVMEKFSDIKLSLTDATNYILINEYKLDNIFTLDSHFQVLGLNEVFYQNDA